MGSPNAIRMEAGQEVGTAAVIKVPLPFTPRKVELVNVTGLAKGEWSDTMAQDSVVKTITDGTITFETSDGIIAVTQLELDDGADPTRGFTIGADSDLNVSAEIIHWVAYE